MPARSRPDSPSRCVGVHCLKSGREVSVNICGHQILAMCIDTRPVRYVSDSCMTVKKSTVDETQ